MNVQELINNYNAEITECDVQIEGTNSSITCVEDGEVEGEDNSYYLSCIIKRKVLWAEKVRLLKFVADLENLL